MESGETDAARIVEAVRARMKDVEIDYVALVDTRNLKPVERVAGPVMLATAAFVGKTRLIDNVRFEPVAKTATEEHKETGTVEVELNCL
jgi:pantoate--beta-alanine ligase